METCCGRGIQAAIPYMLGYHLRVEKEFYAAESNLLIDVV